MILGPLTTGKTYAELRSDIVRKLADETDCYILEATPTTLQLDLDTDDSYNKFLAQWSMITERGLPGVTLLSYDVLVSRNGNRHVIVTTGEEHEVEERIMLQALLGSDVIREALSLMRNRYGDTMPILLLRPKGL